jgi:ferredoxin
MKLVVDSTACQGYGLCQQAAPDLVDLDDWGYAGLLGDGTVPAGQDGHAHEAVDACPAQALRVQK